MSRTPRSAGAQLVTRLKRTYAFDVKETVLLELVAHQRDDIARLEELLAAEGMSVIGSTKQPKLNPVLAELRLQRVALARLLAELALPAEAAGEVVGRSPSSRAAQRASRVRWDRVRLEREALYGAAEA